MGGYSDYSEFLTRDFPIFNYVLTKGHSWRLACILLNKILHQEFCLTQQQHSVDGCAWLPDELHGPIVCISSLLLGNQGGMGSSYYGGGGGGSRGSMNGLGGGWGM